jgi:hypothetical protein
MLDEEAQLGKRASPGFKAEGLDSTADLDNLVQARPGAGEVLGSITPLGRERPYRLAWPAQRTSERCRTAVPKLTSLGHPVRPVESG